MWISSHAREPAKTEQTEQQRNPKIETLLSEGPLCEEMSGTIGNLGSLKKAKSRSFNFVIGHNFFCEFSMYIGGSQNEVKSGALSRAGVSPEKKRVSVTPSFGACLTSLVLVERGCLLLHHGEAASIVNNSCEFHITHFHPDHAPRGSLKGIAMSLHRSWKTMAANMRLVCGET